VKNKTQKNNTEKNIMANNEVAGVHNGGMVSVQYTFPLNGEAAVGQIIVPYTGMVPSRQAIQDRVRAETGCKSAVVTSAVVVDQAYNEKNYTCPQAHFVGGDAPAQAKVTANHYEDAHSTELGESMIIKVKVLGMRQFELNGAGKN
jgi:hypothetical protein